jgi:hypothetical protein
MKNHSQNHDSHEHKKCKCDKDCKRCKALKEIDFELINQK